MSRPRRVWAVTSGSYSDYRINALFTTKALAEQNVEAGAGDEVEEFLLYDRVLRRKTIYSMGARIWPDGSVNSEFPPGGEPTLHEEVAFEDGSYHGPLRPIMEARTMHAPYAGKDWIVRVSGTDKAKVMKSFHDRVAEARARTLGIA